MVFREEEVVRLRFDQALSSLPWVEAGSKVQRQRRLQLKPTRLYCRFLAWPPPECTIRKAAAEGLRDRSDRFTLVISHLGKAIERQFFRTVTNRFCHGRLKGFFGSVVRTNTTAIYVEHSPFTPVLGSYGNLSQISRVFDFRLHDPWRRRFEAESVRRSTEPGRNGNLPEECFHGLYFTPQWSPRSRILITLSVSGSLLPLVPATFNIFG